ncbi:MAG: glycosyltransferase [Anaerolineae bacterium]
MNVSVIATVLNEGDALQKLLDSLVAQTRLPDEIVIVDGGSTDNTVEVLQQYAQSKLPMLKVMVRPGANISRGRNIAIRAATGEIIASTDAGVRLSRRWLAELIAPFESETPPEVVSGFFLPDPQTTFEVAMGATVLPTLAEIQPDRFLPSSRSVAFRKAAWQAVGGYPEWLDFCEDLIFDFRLKEQAGAFAFAPQAVVYFRPRGSLRAFFKQYYQYARGDGKADLWRKRHAIRYATYLAGVPALLLLGWLINPWWWVLGLVLGGTGLFYTPYRRLPALWQHLSLRQRLLAIGWVPVIRIAGDIAKMAGYPVGWIWRGQRLAHRPELRWRRNL